MNEEIWIESTAQIFERLKTFRWYKPGGSSSPELYKTFRTDTHYDVSVAKVDDLFVVSFSSGQITTQYTSEDTPGVKDLFFHVQCRALDSPRTKPAGFVGGSTRIARVQEEP